MDVPRLAISLSIDTTLHMVDFLFPAIRRNHLSVRALEPPIVHGFCRRPLSYVTSEALLIRISTDWPPFLVPWTSPMAPCRISNGVWSFILVSDSIRLSLGTSVGAARQPHSACRGISQHLSWNPTGCSSASTLRMIPTKYPVAHGRHLSFSSHDSSAMLGCREQ